MPRGENYTDYTYEVVVRVDDDSARVLVKVATDEGQPVDEVKGDFQKRKMHAAIGEAILRDAWVKNYGNDPDSYVEEGK